MEDSRKAQPAKAVVLQPAIFLFSVPTAVMVFDSELKLLYKVKIADSQAAISALTRNEWLPEETAAAKKALGEGKSVVILGFKGKSDQEVTFSKDVKKLTVVSAAAKEELAKLREHAIAFTKRAIAAAVSDDNLIIQAASSIAEISRTANLLVKRLREWYELYFPEASVNIRDHEEFVTSILAKSKKELLEKFHIDEKETMGASLSKDDVDRILAFATTLNELYTSRKVIAGYVEAVMKKHCPNLTAVAGSSTGAELLIQAGSLQRLAMLPSSTIQLLGAEKQLFKHLKDKNQRPPKAGVLQSHPFVTSAKKQDKGRIAKFLADKISIAIRVDYFKGEFVGDRLLAELNQRIQHYGEKK